ncbi:MAG: MFS transporter, partial [Dethiobacteria bacterium]|nr:MFS transporter [Dethiobacteria bacterium]
VNLGVFLGLAILQPLFGYVLDLGWEGLVIDGARIYPLQAYRIGFLVSLAFALTALAAAFLYRDKKLPNSSELPG